MMTILCRLSARLIVLSMAAAMAVMSVAPAAADKRVALVIGNGAYRSAPKLPNPTNDALDVAVALKRLNFEPSSGSIYRAGMDAAAIQFSRAAREADVALFYDSGHALIALGPFAVEAKGDK